MEKPKFNLLDGFIILAVVLVIAAAVYILGPKETSNNIEPQNTVGIFSIELTKAEKSLADKFIAATDTGESVWIGVKERFEAKLDTIEVSPAKKITTDLRSGKAVMGEDPTLYDIVVTVTADALDTETAVSFSGTEIRVGDETAVRGKGFAGYGFITNLKTVTE